LIDITLHQLYFIARYRPLPGWTFDEAKLGPRRGVRIADKFAWVFKITGRHLDGGREIPDFHVLRRVRNHLQHFDPPVFCCTLEEVAAWLNAALSIARLNWRIRQAMSASLCRGIIRLLLSPPVVFVPMPSPLPRPPVVAGRGYSSTCWPDDA
jgi:hypothetical protein